MQRPRTVPRLELIDILKIRPNKVNPRGPDVRENDPHRENLKESIAEFGILVPLVVRVLDGDIYELVDGERRYWIARALKMKTVPALVVDGSLDAREVLQRMFQIHMNRDQWDAVQQCKASEDTYAELQVRHEENQEALINEFAKFTGLDRRTARNRVQFLRWPEDVKRVIYSNPAKHTSYWYVVEIEDKIVEPAERNYPEYFDKVRVDDVRRFLYRKWDEQNVRAAIDVRQAGAISRSQIKKGAERKKVLKILDRLVKDVNFSYGDAFEEFSTTFPGLVEPKLPGPRSLLNLIYRLSQILSQYEPSYIGLYRARRGPRGPAAEDFAEAVDGLLQSAKAFLKRISRGRSLTVS